VNRTTFGIRFVCALAILFATCGLAHAQPGNMNPFSGLFRGSPRDQPHKLDLSGSAFGAWDDNPYAQLPGGNSGGFGGGGVGGFSPLPQTIKPGIATGFQGALAYGYHIGGQRTSLALTANGSFQAFESSASSRRLTFQSYDATGAFATGLTSKISLSLSGGTTYAPFYQYAPFLKSTTSEDSPVGSDYGYAVDSDWARTSSAGATITDRFTKRSSISGTVNWNEQILTTNDRVIDTEGAGIRFSHNVTRKLIFTLGYTISESWFTQGGVRGAPFQYSNVDVSLGYGDGLTFRFGRVYTLSLNVGTSIAKNGDPNSIAKTGHSTQFLVTGNATLTRSIARTWEASLNYNRGVSYMVGFTEPFQSDSASAGLGGPIVQRLYFSLGAGASRSQAVFSQSGNIIAYSGSARLTYGLFSNVGLYAQASYYKYSIPEAALESFGFTPQLGRRSVSAGVSTWLPLIKPPRVRRTPNDQQAGQQ
jgi:hypothetical protein